MNPLSPDDQQFRLPNLEMPLGLRLRHAREGAGMSVSEVAEKLRLKSATIDAIEREDFGSLGAAVYVRGYFNSYARLVGVPTVLIDSAFARQMPTAPALHTTARISHSRYLFDRYAKRAVYLVLTASIVVPVILLATRDQLPRQGATLTPLDAPVTAPTSGAVEATAGVPDGDASAAPPSAAAPVATPERSAGENPVMASLGPFLSPAAPEAAVATTVPLAVSRAGLSLHLRGDSWIEVLDRDGRRLQHGLLRAGESRDFAPGTAARVSLGNAEAVEVRMNGAVTDIAAFRRANVARFTVSSDGSLAPAGG
jgi:cytoskeleton protein RodZ